MARKLVVGIFTFLLIVSVQFSAGAAPSDLISVPLSGTEVELTWKKGEGDTTYDIWMTKNGKTWNKINSSPVSDSPYVVGSDYIEPWVNYYFLVSNEGFVQNNDPMSTTDIVYNATDISIAFPPGQNDHGSYKDNTNTCAKCHRTHTADGPKLLRYATVNDTCKTCHDGTGSKYNVFAGTVDAGETDLESASGLFGNIFNHILDENGQPVDIPVKSVHSVEDGVELGTAPGANTLEGDGWNEPFGCGSCHDAHGSHNYRMLATSLPGSSDVRVLAFAETDKAGGKEKINYRTGMNVFCKGCHQTFYNNPSGDGGEGSVHGEVYSHPIGISPSSAGISTNQLLPLEGYETNFDDNKLMCVTCHFSHGSNKLTSYPNDVNYLLRLDNDGVCQNCHSQ